MIATLVGRANVTSRIYIDDATGSYRVYDTTYSGGRTRRVSLGSSAAHYRVFVHESGHKRLYHFPKTDSHGITEPELERPGRCLPRPGEEESRPGNPVAFCC